MSLFTRLNERADRALASQPLAAADTANATAQAQQKAAERVLLSIWQGVQIAQMCAQADRADVANSPTQRLQYQTVEDALSALMRDLGDPPNATTHYEAILRCRQHYEQPGPAGPELCDYLKNLVTLPINMQRLDEVIDFYLLQRRTQGQHARHQFRFVVE